MKLLAWLTACVLALTGSASDAFAHGGQYVNPGGGLPPGLRDPGDQPPPPPPPPPPVTDSGDDGPKAPPQPPSRTPPSAPPITGGPTLPGTGPARRTPSLDYTSWIFWYAQNGPQIENVKESIYSMTSSETTSPVDGSRPPIPEV